MGISSRFRILSGGFVAAFLWRKRRQGRNSWIYVR